MPAKSTRVTGNRNTAIALIIVCVVGTAILIAARSSETTAAAAPAKVVTTAAPASQPAPEVVKAAKADKPAAKPQSGDAASAPTPASIEGCLVQEDEAFQLKNTAGEDAPKGRSWKSGFLHKGSKPVEIVDARHRLNLARHVGERVSVSGMLEDREMRASSVKRLAESCN
jgi:hypothetical protein